MSLNPHVHNARISLWNDIFRIIRDAVRIVHFSIICAISFGVNRDRMYFYGRFVAVLMIVRLKYG